MPPAILETGLLDTHEQTTLNLAEKLKADKAVQDLILIYVAMILNHHRLLRKNNRPNLPLNLIDLFQRTQQIGAFQKRVHQSLSQVLFTAFHKPSFWTFWAIWVQQELENWNEMLPEICLTPGLLPFQANRKRWNWREIIVIQAMALEAAQQLVETLPLEEESLNMLLGIQDALVEDSSNLDPRGFESIKVGLPFLPDQNLKVSLATAQTDVALKHLPTIKVTISPLSPEKPKVGKVLTQWLWEMANQYGAEVSFLGLIFIADLHQETKPWQQFIQYSGRQLTLQTPSETQSKDIDLKHLYRQLDLIQQSKIIVEERKLEESSIEIHSETLWEFKDLLITHDLKLEGRGDAEHYYETGSIQDLNFSIAPGRWCQNVIDLFEEDAINSLRQLSLLAKNILNINHHQLKLAMNIALFLLNQYWQGNGPTWKIGELLSEVDSLEKIQSLATNSMRRHTFFQEWQKTLDLYRTLGWEVSSNPLLDWEHRPLNDMGWLEAEITIKLSSTEQPATIPALNFQEVKTPEADTPVAAPPKIRKMDKISRDDLEKALSTRGMSQAKLARSLKLDRSTINRWINGSRPIHPRYRPALWELLGEALNP